MWQVVFTCGHVAVVRYQKRVRVISLFLTHVYTTCLFSPESHAACYWPLNHPTLICVVVVCMSSINSRAVWNISCVCQLNDYNRINNSSRCSVLVIVLSSACWEKQECVKSLVVANVARLAFLTPNLHKFGFFISSWRQKIVLAFSLQYSIWTIFGGSSPILADWCLRFLNI